MGQDRIKEIAEFIHRELQAPQGGIDILKDSLIDAGILDSVGVMKLVSFIETQYEIPIGDEDLLPTNFETIASINALIASKQST